MRIMHLIIVVCFLAGCGTKTPLTRPTGPATPPLLGAPAGEVQRDNSNASGAAQ